MSHAEGTVIPAADMLLIKPSVVGGATGGRISMKTPVGSADL